MKGIPSSSPFVEDIFLRSNSYFKKPFYFQLCIKCIKNKSISLQLPHICDWVNPCEGHAKWIGLLPFIHFLPWSRILYNMEGALKHSFHYVIGFRTRCVSMTPRSRTTALFHPHEYIPLTIVFSLFLFWLHF